jgi:gluconate 5-dehydrogenase
LGNDRILRPVRATTVSCALFGQRRYLRRYLPRSSVDFNHSVQHRFGIMQPDFSLTGRLALVTGSSRGIGWAIAQGLAGAGARVILHGRDEKRLKASAARLPGLAGALAFDVSDTTATKAAFETIASDHGRLDILVNNAGVIPRKPLLETTDEDWADVIDSNLSAYFRLSREAARLMVPARSGRIIMISSIMGLVGRPTIPGYVTAKAGLHGMVRALSAELAPHGVTVNAIAPGFIPTDATEALHKDPKFNEWISTRAPMGRWGDPSELAGPTVFLASSAASYVTGHVLVVDGGLTASL